MPTRRNLDVGADGMANVLLLEDPIPRHVSLVSWGANDRPTTSWKGMDVDPDEAKGTLRSPPGQILDLANVGMNHLNEFVSETLDAWRATVAHVLSTPLSPEERSARIRALTVQAGARIAAGVAALTGPVVAAATKTYKAAGLTLPDPPTQSTLQGELDRRGFMAGVEHAAAALTDQVFAAMREAGDENGALSATEAILSAFGEAADVFSAWAASMPSGVVGVPQSQSQEPPASSESPDSIGGVLDEGELPAGQITPASATERAGRRNSKTDLGRLKKIRDLLTELIGDEGDSKPKEKNMDIKAELKKLAAEDPKAFLEAIDVAIKSAQSEGLEVAQKFTWGDTGVDPYSPDAIVSALDQIQPGTALQALIARAVGGVDVDAAGGDNVQVASTMREAFAKIVIAELKAAPQGPLAMAVKSMIAPDVAEAVKMTLKSVIESGSLPAGGPSPTELSFEAPEDANPYGMPDLPGK